MKALKILKILSEDYEYNIEDNSEVLEAITELEALQSPKTCATCSKRLLCEMAQKSKDTFGTKLNEQWFSCYEPKEVE